MDTTVDGVDRQDKGRKHKRKSAHPSRVAIKMPSSLVEFPRYASPISQSSNEFNSSEFESDCHREKLEVHMHEIVDWNDPIARQLEELLLSNLKAIFDGVIKHIVKLGYSQDVAEMAISRKALYTEEGDPISNILHDTLNILNRKEKYIGTTDIEFENFQHLLHYTMVEMISVLREVKPSLTDGDAMWVLLICDLNISLACAAEDCLDNVACNGESSTSSSIPQSMLEVQSSDIISNHSSSTFQKESSPNHQNHKSEAPKFGSFLNSTNNQSPLASEGVKLQVENASLPITAGKSLGIAGVPSQECKSGSSSKRHNKKEITTLRHKFLHMEKTYRACGKGGFKSGKLASVDGSVVEKRLKPQYEIPNQQMKCGSSNTTSTKMIRSTDVACHVSTNGASALPARGSYGTSPTRDAISTSPTMNTNISTPGTTSKPKSELSSCDTQKVLDYCVGIPFDQALHTYVPRDKKDELALKLLHRLQEVLDESRMWNNWVDKKIAQVTNRINKLQDEFRTLKNEKQEAELFKTDKKVLEENAVKRMSEMENAMENTKRQIENATSAAFTLQEENSLLKKELDAAKLWVVKSMTSHQQALEREHMNFKQARSWESQKGLFQDELEKEKHKLPNLQHELDKEKNLQAKVQGRLEQEIVAKEKILAQAASFRKEREQLEARTKSEEDMIRKKEANDLQKYVEDIAKLEEELGELKLNSESEKIAAFRWCIDEGNDSFSRNTPTAKGNWKSNASQTMVLATGSLRREQECVMCLAEEISVVFLPCAHQVVCSECNELHEKQGMEDCPSCRTPIQHRIHAKFAGN
ncbi:putative E3 ubiquitin-protein ligase RF4 [Gastrolobium bilobum]|uniref:putative E3 ubiquitin-protein ligase RF4 n=1 Tax=Gastrolobium bilobum TaxID=150636 RepID=UPI002AAF3EC5|nr:putative E3 ubiquitin-protein ligase RF4 [Gastrolobium bilobum]